MLPKIKAPVYTMVVPSTGVTIKYTAFLVRDEKILAHAIQFGTQDSITQTLKEIIKNCTFGAVDVDKLTSFDVEYIFLQLRSKSKGSLVELQYTCKNLIENTECNEKNQFNIDLNKITVDTSKVDKKIMLTDKIGMMMKYPTLDNVVEIQLALADKDLQSIYSKISNFVECVFEGEVVNTNFTNEEFTDWLGTLDNKQFKKIENFFSSIPVVQSISHVKCKKCGKEEDIILEGLQSFLE